MTDRTGTAERARWHAEESRIRDAYCRRTGAARYSWFAPAHRAAMQQLERELLRALAAEGLTDLGAATLLDVGCGTGVWLREFIKWGARPGQATGIDLLPDRIAEARSVCPGAVTLRCESAAQISDRDASFDIVFQSMVFSSVLDPPLRRQIATEMLRVLKADGVVLWYDYHVDNPRNPDVRGVRAREIRELFPDCQVTLRRVTLVPPLARVVGEQWEGAMALLGMIPWLRTHYLGVIRRRRQEGHER